MTINPIRLQRDYLSCGLPEQPQNKHISLVKVAAFAFTFFAFLLNGAQGQEACPLPQGPYLKSCIVECSPYTSNDPALSEGFKFWNFTASCKRENPHCTGEKSTRRFNKILPNDGLDEVSLKNCNGYLALCQTENCFKEKCTDNERGTNVKDWNFGIFTKKCLTDA